MCKMVCALLVLFVTVVAGFPGRELMFDLGSDTAVVESTVRETRAVSPENIEDLLQPGVKNAFFHTYGDKEGDEGDVQGYSKKSNDKSNDGYKHFDSFHKKDSDKYGFETHSEYGSGDKGQVETGGKSKKYTDADKSLGDDGTKKASKRSYQVSEELRQDDEKHRKPLEEYEVDDGYGDSEGYIDGESENYEEGDGDSEHYEEGAGEGGSNPYTEYDGEEQYAPLKSSSYIVSGGAGGGNAEDYESEGYNADDYDD